jgi:nickel transport protein
VKRVFLVVWLCLVPGLANAHEVLHFVDRGKAIAVKAYFADGEALAYAEYQVFSPADAKIPYQKGRTDRSGYLAFVPDTAGKWRVKVTDGTGHGLDMEVDASDATRPGIGTASVASSVASWAFVFRPILGVAIVGAIFAALIVLYRRKGSGK